MARHGWAKSLMTESEKATEHLTGHAPNLPRLAPDTGTATCAGLVQLGQTPALLTRLSMKEAHQATAADVVAQPQIVSSPEPALGAMSHPKGFPGLQVIGAQRPILAREH